MAVLMFIVGFLLGMSFIVLFEKHFGKSPIPPNYGLPFGSMPKLKKQKLAPKVNDDRKAWLKENSEKV